MTVSSQKPLLLTADWHLDPRHAYRMDVVDYVKRQDVSRIFVLGDVLDRPYGQPVEWVLDVFSQLDDPRITLLLGNHDRKDGGRSLLELLPNVVNDHAVVDGVLCIAHRRDPGDIPEIVARHPECALVLLHQPAVGARLENGHRLDSGLSVEALLQRFPDRVFVSGDIHTPQQLQRRYIYVGAPHHTAYGSDFTPRVLFADLDSRRLRPVLTGLWRKSVVHDVPEVHPRVLYRVVGESVEQVDRVAAAIAEAGGTVEETVVAVESKPVDSIEEMSSSPRELYMQFCACHDVDESLRDYGMRYL